MNCRTDKYGSPIAALDFGCMRLARGHGSIALAAAEQLICVRGAHGNAAIQNCKKGRCASAPL